MPLSDRDRFNSWVRFMSDMSGRQDSLSLNKRELRSVINALDVRIDEFLAGLDITPIEGLAALPAKHQLELILNDIRRRFEVA